MLLVMKEGGGEPQESQLKTYTHYFPSSKYVNFTKIFDGKPTNTKHTEKKTYLL